MRRQWIAAIATGLAALMLAAAPCAAENIADKTVSRNGNGVGGADPWAWVKMFGALALIVALIFVARYLLRRFGLARGVSGGSGAMDVVARLPLTQRQQLYLVHVGRRVVLIGAGPEGLATLSEITDPQEIEQLLTACGAAPKTAKEDDRE